MKKPKFSFGEGGLKGWLAHHAEKIVLGLVGLLVLWFFYRGVSIEPFRQTTPTSLASQAGSAGEHIRRDSWTDVVEPKRNPGFDHVARAEKSLADTSSEYYALSMPLDKLLTRLKKKRTDPDLYPPEQLEVEVAYGALATNRPEGFVDPFWDLESAPPATTTGGTGRRPPTVDPGELLGPAGGGEGTRGSSGKAVPPRILEKRLGYEPNADSVPKGTYVAAVKALIPYRRQVEEFKYRFLDSKEYILDRDTPKYVWVMVQRVEIPDPRSEPDWSKAVSFSTADVRRSMTNWAGTAEPIVDERYYDEALTFAIPPMPLPRDELFQLALHSQTPTRLLEASTGEDQPPAGAEPEEGQPELPGFEIPGTPPVSGGRNGEGGFLGEGSRFRGGREGGGYNEGGLLQQETPRYKLVRFFDFGVQPGKHYRYRVQVWLQDPNRPQSAASTTGSSGRSGSSGERGGGGTLIDPKPETLDPAVLARLKQVEEADAKANRRTWWRTTEWSAPSDPISIPQTRTVLAGKVEPPGVSTIRELGIVYKRGEPSGTVAAAIWDAKKGAVLAGEVEVSRSSVVNFQADSHALHPMKRELKPVYNYSFQTDSVILDMDGGQPLGKGKEQTAPGEFLVLDAQGNLVVRNEFEDHSTYRDRLFLMEQEEQPDDPLFPGGGGEGGRFDQFVPALEGEEGGRPTRRPRSERGS